MNTTEQTEAPPRRTGSVRVHAAEDLPGMRKAGALAAETLDYVVQLVEPGVTTAFLDRQCYDFIRAAGAVPAPLNYRGYPASICTSVNHVVCHGIPGDKVLKKGDILNIDVTVIVDGWHGDSSRMCFVGPAGVKARRLCDVTYEAMMRGIEVIRPGATFGDIGHAVQSFAEGQRCSVVRDFCGHGLGRLFHDAPNVLHYGEPHSGPEFRPGMFFTVEPMINLGKWQVKLLNDGWTAVTKDRSLSAQFEHTIAVTEAGHEILTLSPAGLHSPPYG